MRISIIGYSGSGKSTLARQLSQRLNLPILHLDTVQFLPGWQVRPIAEQQGIVEQFLDDHSQWVIDGNYSQLSYEERMQQADIIIVMQFNRWASLRRVWRRYRHYRHLSRPDMTIGCPEKLDWEFLSWILWTGRTKKYRMRYHRVMTACSDKVIVLRHQADIDALLVSVDTQLEVCLNNAQCVDQ